MARIVLDVGGIVGIHNGIKTGIPRVEFAVFNYLSECYNGDVAFLINQPSATGFYRVTAQEVIGNKIRAQRRSVFSRLKRSLKKRFGKKTHLYRPANGGHFEPWLDDDCYLSIANIWEKMSADEFSSLRNQSGLKIALFCHDLAPIVLPHLYTERARSSFSWCLEALARADLVICNSLFTQSELQRLANSQQLTINSQVVQLDATISHAKNPGNVAIEFLINRRYVLVVSSINDRKNHDLLLNLWASYDNDSDIRDVCLVVVGTKGWGAEKVMRKLKLDGRLANRVFHLPDVSDASLDWLYRHCMFTVYPSLYEGWGLPISESLAYEKVCVASSTTSMPEASHGLAVHIDPLDFMSWKEALRKLMTEENYRQSLEQNIKLYFVRQTWPSIAKAIVDCTNLIQKAVPR